MGKMTIFTIRDSVREIKAKAGDAEVAHSMEDKLFENVLRHISKNAQSFGVAAFLAREALKSKKIDFDRWCS